MATFLAFILMMGGLLWGTLLLLVFFDVHGPVEFLVMLLIFGPGYFVTAGYFVRAAALVPSVSRRRLIWGASSLVQGLWLCFDIGLTVEIGGLRSGLAWMFFIWWTFAFVSSVYCLFTDTQPLRLAG